MTPPAAVLTEPEQRVENPAHGARFVVLPLSAPPAAARECSCDQCGRQEFRHVLSKASARGEMFHVLRCQFCNLVQVNPRPPADHLGDYYGESYFERRTDRGYDNYFSESVRASIHATTERNLHELGFFEYEAELKSEAWLLQAIGELEAACQVAPRALDIGCAAGYFVDYLRARGWRAEGVEISAAAAAFGREQLGLTIHVDDFMKSAALQSGGYDLLTLWASIEHLAQPRAAMLRAAELLKPGGRMLLSTCRYGLLARALGKRWRFLNVPEHLFYFSRKGFRDLAQSCGFDVLSELSYGSGMTARKGAGTIYRTAKKIADGGVKLLNQGDMMAFHLIKA